MILISLSFSGIHSNGVTAADIRGSKESIKISRLLVEILISCVAYLIFFCDAITSLVGSEEESKRVLLSGNLFENLWKVDTKCSI